MKRLLIIEADTNDGDYITSENILTGRVLDNLPTIKKVVKAISECTVGHNWNTIDYDMEEVYEGILTTEEIEIFNEVCPNGEYGIHTIESIRILTIADTEDLL